MYKCTISTQQQHVYLFQSVHPAHLTLSKCKRCPLRTLTHAAYIPADTPIAPKLPTANHLNCSGRENTAAKTQWPNSHAETSAISVPANDDRVDGATSVCVSSWVVRS